jgi:hypothetical protein
MVTPVPQSMNLDPQIRISASDARAEMAVEKPVKLVLIHENALLTCTAAPA